MKAQHTPTPWEVHLGPQIGTFCITSDPGSGSSVIAEVKPSLITDRHDTGANAAFIATAVNSHAPLCEQLENLADAAQLVVDRWEQGDLADAVRGLAADITSAVATLKNAGVKLQTATLLDHYTPTGKERK